MWNKTVGYALQDNDAFVNVSKVFVNSMWVCMFWNEM